MTLMVYYSLIPLPLQIAVVANFAFLQKHVESITVALAWTVGFAWTNLLSMVGYGMGGVQSQCRHSDQATEPIFTCRYQWSEFHA